jgi:hypothetical protein
MDFQGIRQSALAKAASNGFFHFAELEWCFLLRFHLLHVSTWLLGVAESVDLMDVYKRVTANVVPMVFLAPLNRVAGKALQDIETHHSFGGHQ